MAKINVSFIIEILGRPKENVSESLNTIVVKIGAEKGISILNKTYHEPRPLEKSDLFTAFAEVDAELDSFLEYIYLIFTYMPAHIEIISPEKLPLSNLEINEIGNNLVRRLHHYDAVAKTVVVERNMLAQKLKQIAPHLFKKPENNEPPAPTIQKESPKKDKPKTKKKKAKS
jgi:hypothetical protein